jgi:hypothetical protein
MIPRHVGHHADAEVHRFDPPLGDGMRAHLESDALRTALEQLLEQRLQLQAVRCRVPQRPIRFVVQPP